jgi:drug/metabolite transporter (DMT)-like permease
MGMTNFVWSILSIVTMLAVGYLVFDEHITKYDVIGMFLSVIGLYLIFVYGHNN